tara:strand:+ start:938 stop:1066 length:129 start_codon:yes stop_codon:yes gene_type:complete
LATAKAGQKGGIDMLQGQAGTLREAEDWTTRKKPALAASSRT